MTSLIPFDELLDGTLEDAAIKDILLESNERGFSADDLVAGAQAMRARMRPFLTPDHCLDVCGTGGDGLHTYNISTTVAIVVAACGVDVAKHGNRSVSSKSGSSDVLAQLGVHLTDDEDVLRHCLNEANICFLNAPHFHPALKKLASVRAELKCRTIFNVLGPLCNPASPKSQMIGVYDRSLMHPIAQAMHHLGSHHVLVVHGDDGMDECSIAGLTHTTELVDGRLHDDTLSPVDVGLNAHPIESIVGGDAEENAEAMKDMLMGQPSAYRDAVLLNAAAALKVAERVETLQDGANLAADVVDKGLAMTALLALIKTSHEGPAA